MESAVAEDWNAFSSAEAVDTKGESAASAESIAVPIHRNDSRRVIPGLWRVGIMVKK